MTSPKRLSLRARRCRSSSVLGGWRSASRRAASRVAPHSPVSPRGFGGGGPSREVFGEALQVGAGGGEVAGQARLAGEVRSLGGPRWASAVWDLRGPQRVATLADGGREVRGDAPRRPRRPVGVSFGGLRACSSRREMRSRAARREGRAQPFQPAVESSAASPRLGDGRAAAAASRVRVGQSPSARWSLLLLARLQDQGLLLALPPRAELS